MTYSKMRIIVGFFVIIITILTVAFIYFLLKEKGAFANRYSFYFQTQSAASFKVGMPLKYSGFDIGMIDSMELNDDGTVRVNFYVSEKNRKWITKESFLELSKPFIGSAHIELNSDINNDLLPPNSSIELRLSNLDDMITKLQPAVDKALNIIDNIDNITTELSKKDSDLMLMLKHANNFTKKLDEDRSILTSLTGSKNSSDDLINSLNSLEKMTQNIEKITEHLDADIVNPSSEAIKKSNQIIDKVETVFENTDTEEVSLP